MSICSFVFSLDMCNTMTVSHYSIFRHFIDPNECDDPTLNDCDDNAICSNVQLSFACACREGFTDAGHPGGAGRKCVKDDNSTRVMDKRVAALERKSVQVDKKLDEVDRVESDVDDNASKIDDWAYTTIAFVVIASLLLFMVFGLTIYIYKSRSKNSHYLRTGYYNEA